MHGRQQAHNSRYRDPSPGEHEMQTALLRWSEDTLRDLPWRHRRDPWAIHVSEVMLQQTQVDRVVDRWSAFLSDYPDVATCAAAPVADIISHWVGLGFNRRAVLLHSAASVIDREFGGSYPDDLHSLMALPGVGPYTARAIMCFAFERDVGVLDTNVGRVLARWANRSLKATEAQHRADAVVPSGNGWRWNQTMLDLGATVCRRRTPLCTSCPVSAFCGWAMAGCPNPDPATTSAATSKPQSTFEGSDRQGRGRLIDALAKRGSIDKDAVAETMGWPNDSERAERVLGTLIEDGLVTIDGARSRIELGGETRFSDAH